MLALTYILLARAFRSLLLPLKAVLLNLVSLAATFGILVVVFQLGHGSEAWGIDAMQAINPWIPIMIFAFLFGLSMDYEVFMLTRMREAMGTVYGDIGTSVLYTFMEIIRETVALKQDLDPEEVTGLLASGGELISRDEALGGLSLIFWALILVISIKYIVFVLRADNQGEGGILALTALISPLRVERKTGRWGLILLGLFGTALLYGDGMITPAISVLSAVEGPEVSMARTKCEGAPSTDSISTRE